TLTELVVPALFACIVSHPYMQCVCGPENKKMNALDLGPLHSEILALTESVIQDLDIIIGPNVTQESSSFNKSLW
ncbi:hypothetical protein M422DRAFT_93476, partial [Sphaerobolus stellatus SS14]